MLPCVVLAGGLGIRMRPTTEVLPKSLIPVLGRPFAQLQIEWLARQGVERVIYSIGYKGHMIREVLGTGRELGVAISYVDEGEDLRGSGGALRLALDAGALPAEFFVLYGDSYLTVSLADVERGWRASGLPLMMTVIRNSGRWDASNAVLREGRVYYEKGAAGSSAATMEWIDYGLSAMPATAIDSWLRPGQHGDLADLLHRLSSEGMVGGYEVGDRFYEIGSPGGLRDLEEHLRRSALPASTPKQGT